MDEQRLKKLEELKKQRDEIDRLIAELSVAETCTTNIPYTSTFISMLPPQKEFVLSEYPSKDIYDIRIFVNKKCNQVSTDYSHTAILIQELLAYKGNKLFEELFARKLLEQGRIQVSSHLESYKPYAYILLMLNTDDGSLSNLYLKLMMNKSGSYTELQGIYAIYFGYLTLKEDSVSGWRWLAGILNCNPGVNSGYILEMFLLICGPKMADTCGPIFKKILRYILQNYLKEINNPPVEVRIKNLIQELEGSVKTN